MDFVERFTSALWALFVTYVTAIDASLEEVERHLEMGKQFLSKGQFADALTHYHAAVDLDSDNYQTLYRRATVYLAMGKSRSAIPDLDRVIQLKPDFSSARMQRGAVRLKQGNLDLAYIDYENVLSKEKDNIEAAHKLALIDPTREQMRDADRSFEQGDFETAAHYYTQALEACPWDIHLHERRADCYEEIGEVQKAIQDVRATTKLIQDNKSAYLRLSLLYYQIGDTEESLNQIRECLKLDPDDKDCFPHYKKVKKIFKAQESLKEVVQEQNWEECIAKAGKIKQMDPTNRGIAYDLNVHLCKCHAKGGDPAKAITACSSVLEEQPNNPMSLCDRADAFIANEQYNDAIKDYEQALEQDDNLRRAHDGVNRAKKLLKQSKRRDYYKILGVRRTATKKQIMKAYRKLAQQWHPDNFRDETEKKKAETKFINIASAKEVLTDPEKRRQFDSGEDPLDPEQQSGQGGWQHPFFQGFNPFGGGGNFKFHFQ